MNGPRALFLTILVVTSIAAMPLSAAGADSEVFEAEAAHSSAPVALQVQEENATTEGKVGYVEGYRYDDDLPIDDRDDAAPTGEELEAVVYRAMARVEVIRNLTFREEVAVSVISRESYRNLSSGSDDATETERLEENVRYESLFMVDRETSPDEEFATLYGGVVNGFYSPGLDRIVIVSDDPDEPRIDEVTLGHELVHALQDQHFGLTGYATETRDEEHAKDALVEGDANWVDLEYERRCSAEWDCVVPESGGGGGGSSEFHWGLYFVAYQPYSDGPAFVEHLRETGGWAAVNAAYDAPPEHSAEVIHPDLYGDLEVDLAVEDRSTDRWERLESDGTGYATFGEATMAAMLAYPTWESDGEYAIVPEDEFLTGDDFDPMSYDTEYTDGWAGDRLLAYATENRTVDETGYVWRTEWRSPADAAEFAVGYRQLLDYHGADPVDGLRNAYVIEDRYPGAYAVSIDGTTVTIVRAPSIDELEGIRDGTVLEGSDTIELPDDAGDAGETGTDDGDGPAENGTADDGDSEADTNESTESDGPDVGGPNATDSSAGQESPSESETETETNGTASTPGDEESIPGFGFGVAVASLLALALLAAARRD